MKLGFQVYLKGCRDYKIERLENEAVNIKFKTF